MAFRITTNAFQAGGSIPVNFTKDGRDKSPAIGWEEAPEGTQFLALIVEDPDAPGKTFCHWLVYNIPSDVKQLDAGLPRDEEIERGMKQGTNDFGEIGYGGPRPPTGERHQYVFRLYALERSIGLAPGAKHDEVVRALNDAGILARTEVTAFYKSLSRKPKKAAA